MLKNFWPFIVLLFLIMSFWGIVAWTAVHFIMKFWEEREWVRISRS